MNNKLVISLAHSVGASESMSGNYYYFDADPGQELDMFAEEIVNECIKIMEKNLFCKIAGIDNDIRAHFGIKGK